MGYIMCHIYNFKKLVGYVITMYYAGLLHQFYDSPSQIEVEGGS